MSSTNRLTIAAILLLAAATILAVAIVLITLPAPSWLAPLALVAGALGLLVDAWRRREPEVAAGRLRLDLDRLREGRQREHVVRAIGYHRQFQALAETLPRAPLRAALRESMPVIDATVRSIYVVCLGLQAHELGESRGSLAELNRAETRKTIERADATVRRTLDTLRQLYAGLRGSWTDANADIALVAAPVAALDGHLEQLRELVALFEQPARSI